ncbi:hypothetical protein [Metapseudomonas otitidis]|uniref:hypothetical protein n=1 Tax=Metapseudomonas otitidis TaxID=319939 RepID=UPI00244AFDC5|nr:hypothetical protein [Pseudomonas otitidis]MDH0336290.1 hypothetical protein [Pseudomonas otitidis]
MNLPPSLIMGSIPVVLAIASTLIAWRYVQNRMLFFVVAVLTPGGIDRLIGFLGSLYQAVLTALNTPVLDTFMATQALLEATLSVQILATPLILWRLCSAMHKRQERP